MSKRSEIAKSHLPKHVAIIMDGNGRWAKGRGLARIRGHQEAVDSVREITRECARKHLEQLTLYAFSTENWKRPKREVNFLMRLFRKYLIEERKEILDNNIRFAVIGRRDRLPENVIREMETTIEESKDNTGMILCLAIDYGSRAEITDAAKRLAADVKAGIRNVDDIDEEVLGRYLYTDSMSDPDLLIRTGGEMRISNFLLWQLSYAEFLITSVYWPDFRKENLEEALKDYANRERRFGGLAD